MSLPIKKRGRPLLLREKLDSEVKSYIRAVREGGGVVTTSITMAAATAVVQKADRNLLAENRTHFHHLQLGKVAFEFCQAKR